MPLLHRYMRWALFLLGGMGTSTSYAYEAGMHQQLTFLAAKQFDRCVEHEPLPLLTPLEIRYMVKANVALAERGWMSGLLRWHYYDATDADDNGWLWLVQTRINQQFHDEVQALETAEGFAERYTHLGRLLNYVQLMSSPPYALPVFQQRWWRFTTSDRFNAFPLDVPALEAALTDGCQQLDLLQPPPTPQAVLQQVAVDTRSAVLAPIPELTTTWTAFWQPGAAGDFGSYGAAGNNFGRRVEFPCPDRRCRFRDNDWRYQEFANARHAQAVIAGMQLLYWMQWHKQQALLHAVE